MQEIKLRVWDKKAQKMILWDELKQNKFTLGLLLTSKIIQSNSVIMLYTGLLDKNGKEIYEEDYLFDGKKIHRVQFVVTDYWSGFDFNGLQNITKYCEIIGNSIEDDYDELYEKYLGGEKD